MTKLTPKEIFKKGFIILSGLAFFWFSASSILKMVTQPATPPVNQSQGENSPPESIILQNQAKGYELVLSKEPDNRFALEKLVEIYLQSRNLSAALPLMEKLVTIEPQNERYQEVLKIIKQGLAQEKSPTQPSINSPNNNEENKEK